MKKQKLQKLTRYKDPTDVLRRAEEGEVLLTKVQLANFLQLTPRSVEMWMSKGMPHFKVGSRRTRFDLVQVKDFLRDKCGITRAA